MAASAADVPVDLGALRAAAAPVIVWYEGFLAGRPSLIADLDVALQAMRTLPPIGGRLGRALALVAAGGRLATTRETIAALETIRATAGLRPLSPPRPVAAAAATDKGSVPKRRRRGREWSQPELPGIGGR